MGKIFSKSGLGIVFLSGLILVGGLVFVGAQIIKKQTPAFPVTSTHTSTPTLIPTSTKKPLSITCSKLAEKIKKEIVKANYCKTNEDCWLATYGYPFECEAFVNKEIGWNNKDDILNDIRKEIKSYREQCDEGKDKCDYSRMSELLNPICVNNKCVETQELCVPGQAYVDLTKCRCPTGTIRTTKVFKGAFEAVLVCEKEK